MEFKYASSILFSHMGYIMKILVWLLISIIITAAIGCAIFIPLGKVIVATTDVGTYFAQIKDIVAGTFNGTCNTRGAFTQIMPILTSILQSLTTNAGACVGLVFGALVVYLVYSFFAGLSFYTVSDIINNIMTSNMRFGFASNMAMNFKRCCKYSLARITITLPIDIIVASILCSVVIGLFGYIKLFVLPIAVLLMVVFCSLRATLLAAWLPRMIYHPEEKVYTSLTRSFTYVKYNVSGLFKAYAITFTLVYLISSVFAVPTVGLIFLVLPATYYFLLRAVELVGYFKTKGYNFYTDATTVVNTVEYGLRKSNQQAHDDYLKSFGDDKK